MEHANPIDELARTIRRAMRGLRFGSLEIVVHDSKIVRIERRERIRLDADPPELPSKPTANAEANPRSET